MPNLRHASLFHMVLQGKQSSVTAHRRSAFVRSQSMARRTRTKSRELHTEGYAISGPTRSHEYSSSSDRPAPAGPLNSPPTKFLVSTGSIVLSFDSRSSLTPMPKVQRSTGSLPRRNQPSQPAAHTSQGIWSPGCGVRRVSRRAKTGRRSGRARVWLRGLGFRG